MVNCGKQNNIIFRFIGKGGIGNNEYETTAI